MPHPFDIVITTNSGYPLDLNLYQAVKGMSAAAQIVKPRRRDHRRGRMLGRHPRARPVRPAAGRGASKSAASCWHRVTAPGFLKQDQWQAQIQAQIQLKADVYVRTSHLTDAQLRRALLRPCPDIVGLVAELRARVGPDARICVLPEGPQTIPYLS